ncbi:MAG: NPXTG-anchored protein [Clostridia bacterium]|nr:NPXTG-anchored protein [Clostridia bacterium]
MKKKVLAVLVAVCMIVSTCVLFASAATFAQNTYVEKINANANLLPDNIKAIASNAFNIDVTASAKTGITLNSGTTEVNDSNVDSLVQFKAGTATLTFAKDLASYFTVSGTISGNNATVNFAEKSSNNMEVYQVTSAIDTATDTDIAAKTSPVANAKKYNLSPATVNATVSKWVTKLSSVTMGVRFFGSTYDNLVASEIAKVTATVNRKSGASTKVTTSVTNVIKDLMPGDTVTLKASLKDEAEKEYYGFYCWVDGSGNVLSTSDTVEHTVDGTDVAFYATYVELKDRFTIDYTSNGDGKVIYNEGREVFSGDAQISVLGGRDATFTFVPDEGFEVAKVVIDGKTDVASFKSINLEKLLQGDLSSLKNLINATNKETYCYTFPKVGADHTIEVTFAPIENFEAPSGLDLPTVEAEGITLATGADAENGEGGNSGSGATTVPAEDGAAGNGGNAAGGVVNPATGSTGAIAVFAVLSVAAGAAFVTMKKKED